MQGKDFKERDCMSFDGFCISVRIDIQRRLGDSFLVYLNDVTKNNDTKLKALVITEQGTNLHPNIYMEGFYDRYRNGVPLLKLKRLYCRSIGKAGQKKGLTSPFSQIGRK